jgi:TolB-like protein
MKQVMAVVVFLIGVSGALMAGPGETTLAVLDFENNSFFNAESYQALTKGLAEMMITELQQIQAIKVVERRRLRTMLEELKLSQSGLVEEKGTLQVGKLLGARHLVFGGFLVGMDEKIRIDVRIVEVETGLTIKASEVTGRTKQVLSLIKQLSKKIMDDLDIRLSQTERKVLDRSRQMDLEAVMWFSRGVEKEDLGDLARAKQYYRKALSMEPEFHQAERRLRLLDSEKNP